MRVVIRSLCHPCPVVLARGETKQEALSNIREAIQLYLEPVEDELVLHEQALVQEIEV
jgi:predicted RNase H-like HicB family nuclease